MVEEKEVVLLPFKTGHLLWTFIFVYTIGGGGGGGGKIWESVFVGSTIAWREEM